MELDRIRITPDGTHHELDGRPLYRLRYRWVLTYHPPGLAAAGDETGSFHIRLDGKPAYTRRFLRTFGFYEELAAIQSDEGWGHVDPTGSLVYPPTFAWVGNFQEQRCTVRTEEGYHYHILPSGRPAY